MFVPVACLRCGKLFQVPPASAGTDVPCPWCRQTTPALPVAAVPAAPPPEPLSLDDADPAPPPAVPPNIVPPPAPAPAPAAPPRRRRPVVLAVALAVALPLVAAATVGVLGYHSGRVSPAAWQPFAAPDGSFSASLPGTPAEAALDPNPTSDAIRGGKEYAVERWYSGVRVWVAYHDLDPDRAKALLADPDGALAKPVLDAEQDRRVRGAKGTVTKVGSLRASYGRGYVVQADTPRGKRVEHYVVSADGPRPRLYVVGIEAPHLDPDGPLPGKVFAGFRPN